MRRIAELDRRAPFDAGRRIAWVVVPILLSICLTAAADVPSPPSQKGMTYASWRVGGYSGLPSDQSLTALASTGTNWVSIVVTAYQNDIDSTTICYQNEITPPATSPSSTPTDADLTHVINLAHTLGLSVMLKPHIDLAFDSDHWRGEIGRNFTAGDWTAWFTSYTAFITHYAVLADTLAVEQFCVGTELTATTARSADWRSVVAAIGAVYDGPLVYAANWYNEDLQVTWWDALDFIGIDAYYPLVAADNLTPTLVQLEGGWSTYVTRMSDLSTTYGKHVILTELGYRSLDGTCGNPSLWQSDGTPDRAEQSLAYRATFESFFGHIWFEGVYWWVWETDPLQGSPYSDLNYTPHHKPAERTLRTYYGGPDVPMLSVESAPIHSVPVTGAQAGATDFSRTMASGAPVSMATPYHFDSSGTRYTFVRWLRGAASQTAGKRQIAFSITDDTTASAAYKQFQKMQIFGPISVKESYHATYKCYVYFTDGSHYTMTPYATWKDNSSRSAFTKPGYLKTISVKSDTRVRICTTYAGKSCYLWVTIRNTR